MERDHRTLKHVFLGFGFFLDCAEVFITFCFHKTNAPDSGSKVVDCWTVRNLSVLRHQKSQKTSKTGGSQKQRRLALPTNNTDNPIFSNPRLLCTIPCTFRGRWEIHVIQQIAKRSKKALKNIKNTWKTIKNTKII